MYTAVYEKVPQGYIAWLEEVPGVLTQGKTKREAQENLKDAFKEFMLAHRLLSRKETKGKKTITRERFVLSRGS
jgi:predicted RNase H-like HicB family nuclease